MFKELKHLNMLDEESSCNYSTSQGCVKETKSPRKPSMLCLERKATQVLSSVIPNGKAHIKGQSVGTYPWPWSFIHMNMELHPQPTFSQPGSSGECPGQLLEFGCTRKVQNSVVNW